MNFCCGRTTETRGVLRGPRGPKNLPECRLFNSESFTIAEHNTNREFMFCKYGATAVKDQWHA